MDMLSELGIDLFKIRSVKTDIYRTAWVLNEAKARGAGRRETCAKIWRILLKR